MPKPPLNARQEAFITRYCVTLNATQAAIDAGYSTPANRLKGARAAARLMHNARIRERITAFTARRTLSDELSAMRVLEELRRIALFDIRLLFDGQGKLKPIELWTPEQGSMVSQCEVVQGNVDKGDGQRDRVVKLRFWDKSKAIEMLAKHYALCVERTEVSGGITVSWLPAAPRGEVVDALPPSPAPETLSGSAIPVSADLEQAKGAANPNDSDD